MRAVSFVKRLQWDLPGTVCRHGLTIGDVDNDGDNELVVGTAEGELYIFKGSELWQKINGLGLITSVAIGDIFNYGRNALVIICGDGWAHIFYSPRPVNPTPINSNATAVHQSQVLKESTGPDINLNTGQTSVDMGTGMTNSLNSDQLENSSETGNEFSGKMECVHVQRIPTNTKVVLIADVDKDGANEMILGLTDRVVRSYRWSSNAELGTGKLVGLNKWECADQIGTVTLQHSRDGTPTLLVAQPGGTFMRIKCNAEDCRVGDDDSAETNSEAAASCVDYETLGISRMRNPNISTEIIGDLEPGSDVFVSPLECEMTMKYMPKNTLSKQGFLDDTQLHPKAFKPSSLEFRRNYSQPEMRKSSLDANSQFRKREFLTQSTEIRFHSRIDSTDVDQIDGNFVGGNVILGEFENKPEKKSFLPSYESFTHDNNNSEKSKNVGENEEDAADDQEKKNGKPYALATLDGTIMLVKDEIILWAMQVDHQIFALCRLDVTGDGTDEIVACTWDGQTYILDQKRNSVRFQFEEPVRAFCTGQYSVSAGSSSPCLVYNTFHNKIFLYYDVILPSMVIGALNPTDDLEEDEKKILDDLIGDVSESKKQEEMRKLTEWLLYGPNSS